RRNDNSGNSRRGIVRHSTLWLNPRPCRAFQLPSAGLRIWQCAHYHLLLMHVHAAAAAVALVHLKPPAAQDEEDAQEIPFRTENGVPAMPVTKSAGENLPRNQ